jgi:hypothetical protein
MARIHQCDDLVKGRFLIDADGVPRHYLVDKPGTHASAGGCVFFDPEQFFEPVSGWRADIELGSMQEIALRNKPDKRSLAVDHRQTPLIGLHEQMRGVQETSPPRGKDAREFIRRELTPA